MASLSEIRARALALRGSNTYNNTQTILGVWDRIGDAPEFHDLGKLQVDKEIVRRIIREHCPTGCKKTRVFMRYSILLDYGNKGIKILHTFVDPKMIDLFERGVVVHMTPIGKVDETGITVLTSPLVLLDGKELWNLLIFNKIAKVNTPEDPTAIIHFEVYGLLFKEIAPEEHDLYMEYLKMLCREEEKRNPGLICLFKDDAQPMKFMDYLRDFVPLLFMGVVINVYGPYYLNVDREFGRIVAMNTIRARREIRERARGQREYVYSII